MRTPRPRGMSVLHRGRGEKPRALRRPLEPRIFELQARAAARAEGEAQSGRSSGLAGLCSTTEELVADVVKLATQPSTARVSERPRHALEMVALFDRCRGRFG